MDDGYEWIQKEDVISFGHINTVFAWKDVAKPRKTSVKIAGQLAEIQIWYTPGVRTKCEPSDHKDRRD